MNNMGINNNMNNNMIIPNNNMIMPNQISGLNIMDMNNYENDWLAGYNEAMIEIDKIESNEIKVTFKTTQEVRTNIVFKKGTTIDEMIKKYLYEVNKPELIKQKEKGVVFLYNAKKLELGNKTKIEDLFPCNSNPEIIVNDIHNLIKG